MEKFIVSKGWEGFGDRLQCLSHMVNAALRYNRTLYVDWTDTIWGTGFYRYFHLVDLPHVQTDREVPHKTAYPPFWKNKIMLPANGWVYDMKDELAFDPTKGLHYEDVWVHCGIGYREYDFCTLQKHLRINRDVATVISARLVDFDLPVVHLRGTDRAVADEKWAELRTKVPIAWVVSDDAALTARWLQESPESKVFSKARAGITHYTTDVDKHEMNLEVLTDFFALAYANEAHPLNEDSLFFSMARLLGICDKEQDIM